MKPSASFEQTWRQRFERFAEKNEDDAGIAGWSALGLEARFRHFRRVWDGGEPGGEWLDAGCGAGTYSRLLAGQGLRVTAVDYSLPSLKKARQRSGGAIQWAAADVNHLPVKRASMRGALCFGVLQALGDAGPALRELSATVSEGGEVWVDALNAWCLPYLLANLWQRLRGRPLRLRYDSPGVLRRQMRDSGMAEVRLYWVPILPRGFEGLQRLLETAPVQWLIQWTPLAGRLFCGAIVCRGRRIGGHSEPPMNTNQRR